jgi:hypothetical protein
MHYRYITDEISMCFAGPLLPKIRSLIAPPLPFNFSWIISIASSKAAIASSYLAIKVNVYMPVPDLLLSHSEGFL